MGSSAWTDPAYSVDEGGLTLALTTPQSAVDDIRTGVSFRPDILAAGRLIHLHRSPGSWNYLAVFSERWTAATPKPTLPGEYSAKTVVSEPSAFWVGPSRDTRVAVNSGAAGRIHSSSSIQAVAGASNGHLMVLLCTIGGVGTLVRYRVDGYNFNVVSSQYLAHTVPGTGEHVVWNRGVHISGTYLYVVGARPTSGDLFVMKLLLTHVDQSPLYLGEKGWTPDPMEMAPMRRADNTALASTGPVSIARYGAEWYIIVGTTTAGTYAGRVYRTRHPVGGWKLLDTTIGYGSDSEAAAFFQNAVQASPSHPDLDPAQHVAGLPFTFTQLQGDALRTRWRVLGVPRFRL